MPCTSCLYGKWVEDVYTGQFGVFVYLVLRWAAAPGLVAVLPMWDSAYVSGTVTSQAIGFPLAHGRRVVPSGRLLLLLFVYYFYFLSPVLNSQGMKKYAMQYKKSTKIKLE